MHIMQSRRDFLATLSALGGAGVLGTRASFADQAALETTTIRLRRDPSICVAPWYIAEDLLRAEGFTDIRYVPVQAGPPEDQMIARGGIDFSLYLAGNAGFSLGGGLADHGAHGRAYRVFRAVCPRADLHHQRPQGQEGRHRFPGGGQTPVCDHHGGKHRP